ncbi:MAG: hypothetical protein ABIV25_01480 [Paracoccaceae bacterium]
MQPTRTIGGAIAVGFGLLLSACAAPQPMTMPPADGRAETVVHAPYRYVVGRQEMVQAAGRVSLRVTRDGGPDMDYSDGLVAKQVAEEYCAHYRRSLNHDAFGMFSAPASWIFDGGCQ